MAENQMPATQDAAKIEKLAKQLQVSTQVVTLLTPQQLGWLNLARNKVVTFEAMERDELKVQEILKDINEDEDLKSVQDKIKQAKDVANTSQDQRLLFTNGIKEKLTDPAMAYEKRNQSVIRLAEGRELELRKKVNKAEEEKKAKEREEASLKAHIANEHVRIGTAYRLTLTRMVSDAYMAALDGPKDPKEIPAHIKAVMKFMSEVKLEKFQKFNRAISHYEGPEEKQVPVYKYIDNKRAAEIYKEIEEYDPKQDLIDAQLALTEKFKMYEHDFKNAKKAKAAEKTTLARQEEEIITEAEQESETNNLMAEVDTYTISNPGVKTTIKKSYKIDEDNSEAWALAVLDAFVRNWAKAKEKLKVKSWGKLTLTQMGNALAALKTEDNSLEFKNINFTTIEK